MQSKIEVTEEDFFALGDAAQAALSRGDKAAAEALDKLARKALAALSTRRIGGWSACLKPMKWEEMPTTLSDQAPDNIRAATARWMNAAEDLTLDIEYGALVIIGCLFAVVAAFIGWKATAVLLLLLWLQLIRIKP